MHYCGVVPAHGLLQLAMLEEIREPEPPIRLAAVFFEPGSAAQVEAELTTLGEVVVGIGAPAFRGRPVPAAATSSSRRGESRRLGPTPRGLESRRPSRRWAASSRRPREHGGRRAGRDLPRGAACSRRTPTPSSAPSRHAGCPPSATPMAYQAAGGRARGGPGARRRRRALEPAHRGDRRGGRGPVRAPLRGGPRQLAGRPRGGCRRAPRGLDPAGVQHRRGAERGRAPTATPPSRVCFSPVSRSRGPKPSSRRAFSSVAQ